MANNYILPFLWMKGESREIIQKEIEKIDECGIKAICLESRPHPDFMGPKWWDDMAFIIEEAKKRDMKIWILDDAHFPTGYANGLIKDKYPERKKRYLRYNMVNVWGKTGAITVNVKQMTKPLVSFLELDKPMDFAERAKNKLVSVVAYPLRGDNQLDENGAIDLTDKVVDGMLTYRFPKDNYRLFVVYETCTDGGNPEYINMMDKVSVSTQIEAVYEPHYEHLKEEFGKTIVGFFSDEPPIGNYGGFDGDTQVGNPNMPLPWSEALRSKMEDIYGADFNKVLPYLWMESVQMSQCPQVRHNFMDIVTALYQENFSCQLGQWCAEHNVEYIGHIVEDSQLHQRLGNGIGHFFRAMDGQHMAGIDAIADQIIPGDKGYVRSGVFPRDGAFFHYGLAKMGASAGHLDPKKKGRTMCELFGASGWETGTRNMKFILDHLLARGVNYLVPHAFSMAEYPDPDCPPHFYARGKNPQFRYFVKLMKYANRMCDILAGGKHVAPVAMLYTAEADWSGKAMTLDVPGRVLQEHQVEYDVVSADMLADLSGYNGAVDGTKLMINGQTFECLLVPQAEHLTAKAYRFMKDYPQVPVIFVNEKPANVVGQCVSKEELDAVLANAKVVSLEELGVVTQLLESVKLEEAFEELVYYHYNKNGKDTYVFHNESAYNVFKGAIALPIKHEAVYYDAMEDKYYKLPMEEKDGKKVVTLELHPFALSVVFDMEVCDELPVYEALSDKLSACDTQSVEGAWNYALTDEVNFPEFGETKQMDVLQPVSNLISDFSGHVAYEKEIEVTNVGTEAYLEFSEAYEAVELFINGESVGSTLYPPYVFEISGYLKEGKNTIKAIVTSTLDRDQVHFPEPFVLLDYHVSEAVGLDGAVVLYQR